MPKVLQNSSANIIKLGSEMISLIEKNEQFQSEGKDDLLNLLNIH